MKRPPPNLEPRWLTLLIKRMDSEWRRLHGKHDNGDVAGTNARAVSISSRATSDATR